MRRLTEQERMWRRVTGGQLTRSIIREAKRFGWLVHHSRPALYARGGRWATQVSGHTGLPDLVLVRAPEVAMVEVKREVGDALSPAQEEWRRALLGCPAIHYLIVRPSSFSAFVHFLASEHISMAEEVQ